jgi:hypothetical protein
MQMSRSHLASSPIDATPDPVDLLQRGITHDVRIVKPKLLMFVHNLAVSHGDDKHRERVIIHAAEEPVITEPQSTEAR